MMIPQKLDFLNRTNNLGQERDFLYIFSEL